MNLISDVGGQRIGGWRFYPGSGELRRSSEVRRLEPRAAKTLEMLVAAHGAVVTQDELIRQVWSGRSLSENSVAVVVGQLRKALDDDAREPKIIETIPKRGYRLIGRASAESTRRHRARRVAAGVLALLLAIGAILWVRSISTRPAIARADIVNQTGDRRYDELARATTELMLAELSKRGYDVERGGRGPLLMTGKLVIWNGGPSLGLSATDANGVVRWSGMTNGAPNAVPVGLHAELDDFQRKVPR